MFEGEKKIKAMGHKVSLTKQETLSQCLHAEFH